MSQQQIDYRPDLAQCKANQANAGRLFGIVFMLALTLACFLMGD